MAADTDQAVDSLLHGLRRLYKQLPVRRRWQLLFVVFLMLTGAAAELITIGAVLPFLALIVDPGRASAYPALQGMFERLGWHDPQHILVPAMLLFAAVALGAGAIRLLLLWSSQKFAFHLGCDLSVEVYRRTLYQPYIYHVSKNTSELIAAINKVQMVMGGMLIPLMQAVIGAVISLAIFGALIAIDPFVALVAMFSFGSMYLAVTALTKGRLRRNSRIIAETQTLRVQTVQEGLGGIRDVLIDRAQPVYAEKFLRVNALLRDAQVVNAFIEAAPRFVIEAFGMVLIAGLALILSGGPDGLVTALPVLGALALGAQRLLPLLQQVYNGWARVAGNRQVLFDVLSLLDLPIHNRFIGARAATPLPFEKGISLSRVSYAYDGSQPAVFENLTISIKKGSRTGIVGKTGSGKSTLVDIVSGLLEPTSGEIHIDGDLLTPDNVQEWQAHIAYVPQFIYLADTTIAENIALGVPADEVDIGRIKAAAAQSELAEFIDGLAHGYDTVVGERGIRLSGGQRQRIGIARALYKKASVLVFDEATSALDTETEAAVMDAIASLGPDLTILIIAHRLTTVEMCNQILRLEGGRVFEQRQPPVTTNAVKLPRAAES